MEVYIREIDKRSSNIIGALSFVCSSLVVLINADVSTSVGSWQFFIAQTIRTITKIAVRFFFAISGYLLAGKINVSGWYGETVKKRIISLMVPFYIWIILYQLFNTILVWGAGLVHMTYDVETFSLTWENLLYIAGLHCFKLAPVIWFLRSLFLLALVSPAFVHLQRRSMLCCIFVFWCAFALHEFRLAGENEMWNFFEYFFSVRGLLFFTIGLFIRRYGIRADIPRSMTLGASGVCILSIVLIALGRVNMHCMIPFVIIPFMVSALQCVAWAVDKGWLSGHLQRYSMPVYLMHMPILIVLAGICSATGLKSYASTSIVAMIVKTIISVCASVIFFRLLNNRIARILLGGRI